MSDTDLTTLQNAADLAAERWIDYSGHNAARLEKLRHEAEEAQKALTIATKKTHRGGRGKDATLVLTEHGYGIVRKGSDAHMRTRTLTEDGKSA